MLYLGTYLTSDEKHVPYPERPKAINDDTHIQSRNSHDYNLDPRTQ